jgi:TetR/AcrR family transcriptional repressor of nem operon
MYTKGGRTKRHIVACAAPLFNVKGFAGTSIADILEATGLEKGGLYRHFSSKNELAIAAFDFAVKILERRHAIAQTGQSTAIGRLAFCVRVMANVVYRPPLRGGCPILNTAIEADDTHPELRDRAAKAMRAWQRRVAQVARAGVASGEFIAGTDPEIVATIVTSALEGAIMLQDPAQMERVAEHLQAWLGSLCSDRGLHDDDTFYGAKRTIRSDGE